MKIKIRKKLKTLTTALLTAVLGAGSAFCPITSYAVQSWVALNEELTAEGAIVMDADSGAVLWGKNIDTQYCPASITKLMTGLVVLENCSLDEEVTVTSEAVSNLESGASAVGLAAGDVLTVDELLHAMLLRSANDAANVLACYVSGDIDSFAEKMTQRAKELGCKNTIFRNPSGLTKPENVTTAYDMALIAAECARTPGFLEVESKLSYKIRRDSKYPDGFTVHQEHKMILKGTVYSDSRVIGGKTGFIKASGNTLVTIAEDNGLRLVAVVLKDKNPAHYLDTEKMLDFGFDNFESRKISDPVGDYAVTDRLIADKIIESNNSDIRAEGEAKVTLPKGADLADVKVSYDYNIKDGAPEGAVAKMIFKYDGVNVGNTYIINDKVSDIAVEVDEGKKKGFALNIPAGRILSAGLICIVLAAVIALIFVIRNRIRLDRERNESRRARRLRRLRELDMSEDEFRELVRRSRSRKRK